MHGVSAFIIVGVITYLARSPGTAGAWGVQQARTVLVVLLGLMYLPPSIAKVVGSGKIADNFRAWGYPGWALHATGGLQLLGVALLAVPRSAFIGALLLAGSAVESAYVNGTHGAGAMVAFPALQLVFALVVAWLHRPSGHTARRGSSAAASGASTP